MSRDEFLMLNPEQIQKFIDLMIRQKNSEQEAYSQTNKG
jgi:hypothetical protein